MIERPGTLATYKQKMKSTIMGLFQYDFDKIVEQMYKIQTELNKAQNDLASLGRGR